MPSLTEREKGFSTKTWIPRSMARRTVSAWYAVGVATMRKSGFALSMSSQSVL